MAKKGQKYIDYSDDVKDVIVQAYLAGLGSYRGLAKQYNITSWHTIATWVERYRRTGSVESVRDKKTKQTEINYKVRYEILKNYLAFLNKEHPKK